MSRNFVSNIYVQSKGSIQCEFDSVIDYYCKMNGWELNLLGSNGRLGSLNCIMLNGKNDADLNKYNTLLGIIDKYRVKRFTITGNRDLTISCKGLVYPSYNLTSLTLEDQLTILTNLGGIRFILSKYERVKGSYNSRDAWSTFYKSCTKNGINLEEDYQISKEEGFSIRYQLKTDKSVSIRRCFTDYVNRDEIVSKTFENMNHLDLNSSYMSGLVYYHPEFKNVISEFYKKKSTAKTEEEKDKWKKILTIPYGWMYSELCDYRYAHLSRDMIKYNDMMLDTICKNMIETGRLPILFNTDGIWYQGDIYHDENEGTGLGQWKTDHKNCTWRCRSSACYEYVENGEYNGQCSGVHKENFQKWGDIFIKHKTEGTVFERIDGFLYRHDKVDLAEYMEYRDDIFED